MLSMSHVVDSAALRGRPTTTPLTGRLRRHELRPNAVEPDCKRQSDSVRITSAPARGEDLMEPMTMMALGSLAGGALGGIGNIIGGATADMTPSFGGLSRSLK